MTGSVPARSHTAPRMLRSIFRFICLFLPTVTATTMPASELSTPAAAQTLLTAYVGTYTKTSDSRGVYRIRFDATKGTFSQCELVAELINPSFIALRPDRRALYVVSEASQAVHAFAGADSDAGPLTPLNAAPTRGAGPCDVAVDATGNTLAVANYSAGSITAWRLESDGRVGRETAFFQNTHASKVNAKRQAGPHAHGVTFSPDNRLLLVPDLGGDRVYVFRHDSATSLLTPHATAPWIELPGGSGPRHGVFSPDGRQFYVINELANTVSVFGYNAADGTFAAIEHITTLPGTFAGVSTTAELALTSDGLTLYGSNRGHDSLARFRRDPQTGRLSPVDHVSSGGGGPRHFTLTPDARWLVAANQTGNNLVAFRVGADGALVPAPDGIAGVGAPVCVKFR